MHFRRPLLAAAAIATAAASSAATPQSALAQETGFEESLRVLQRLATQYSILLTRMFVDMTYDSIAIEPGTNDLIVTGLRLYPEFDWDHERRCAITVERAVIADSNSFETLRTTMELSGVALPPARTAACADPKVPDRLPPSSTPTTSSASARASRSTRTKSAGEGCEVVGRSRASRSRR